MSAAHRVVHHCGEATAAYTELKALPRWRFNRRAELRRELDFHCRAADLARITLNGGPVDAPGLRELLDLVDAGELDATEALAITRSRRAA